LLVDGTPECFKHRSKATLKAYPATATPRNQEVRLFLNQRIHATTVVLIAILSSLAFSYPAAAQVSQPPNVFPAASTLSVPGMFPFVIPPFDDAKTATDVSWLNNGPAGAKGFIGVNGENFVDGAGQPIRFWGVNLNFRGVFPDKTEAPKVAARIAKFGFNAVRMHHFDGNAAPNGIWKAATTGSNRVKIPREIDPDQLDRLHFFIAELIKNGIYINFNLHVGRKLIEGEGIAFPGRLPEKDKGVNYYDAKLVAAHKEFSRFILTTVNPYTGRSYKDEPAVCTVEVANENSLLSTWLDGSMTKFPEEQTTELAELWTTWLRNRYTPEALRAAWTEASEPLDATEILSQPWPLTVINPDAPDSKIAIAVQSLRRFQLATVSGAAGRVDVDSLTGPTVDGFLTSGLTVNLDTIGSLAWAFQLNRDGLDLQEGRLYTLSFWARADRDRRITANLWQDRMPNRFSGFSGNADLNNDWKKFTFVLRPTNVDPQHSRLSFNLGNLLGVVQLGEIELRAGGVLGAPTEWTLDRAMPLIDFKTMPVWRVRRDFAEFLGEVEKNHVLMFRNFLKKELGVRCPIWHSQALFGGWGGLWRELESDAIDVHAYWKHPNFGGAGWSGTSWKIENSSMAATAGDDPLSAFAMYRAPGKPFVMTEWNNGQPNDFGAETLPMIAAYAANQNWASVYLFDYHSAGSYDRDRFEGFFSIDTHPVKMATAPASALIYRRPQEVAVAQSETVLTIPTNQIWDEVANLPGPPSATHALRTWRDAGAARSVPLWSRAYVQFGEAKFPTTTRAGIDNRSNIVSDTNELRWDKKKRRFTVNTPNSKLAVGFMGGDSQMLDEFRFTMPASRTNFASLSLSSLDGKPVAQSERLLLTAAGQAENLLMGWNYDRTSVGSDWGKGPTHVEGIAAYVTILKDAGPVRVWALDETGARRAEVTVERATGVVKFQIGPQYRTLWYEVASGNAINP